MRKVSQIWRLFVSGCCLSCNREVQFAASIVQGERTMTRSRALHERPASHVCGIILVMKPCFKSNATKQLAVLCPTWSLKNNYFFGLTSIPRTKRAQTTRWSQFYLSASWTLRRQTNLHMLEGIQNPEQLDCQAYSCRIPQITCNLPKEKIVKQMKGN